MKETGSVAYQIDSQCGQQFMSTLYNILFNKHSVIVPLARVVCWKVHRPVVLVGIGPSGTAGLQVSKFLGMSSVDVVVEKSGSALQE